MLSIDLGTLEYYDESQNEFKKDMGGVVRFEYSLKNIYDWEYIYRKPFLKGGATQEELFHFYKLMALDEFDHRFLSNDVCDKLAKYISDSNTATRFNTAGEGKSGGGKVYTSEELYALMSMENIPLEFENRNLNRLLTIIRVIASYKAPPTKMSTQDVQRQNAELNRQRREANKTKG